MAFLLTVLAIIVLIVWEQIRIKYYDYKIKHDPAWCAEVERERESKFRRKNH